MTSDDHRKELALLALGDKETMRRVAIGFGKTEEEFEAMWAEYETLKAAMDERNDVVPS